MPKYYMLECYGPDDVERAGVADVHGLDGINWMMGQRFKTAPTTPINVTLDADDGIMVPMFYRGILLFSDELLTALRAAGVDNLDLYAAVLTNPKTKARFNNYKAVNILGLVAAADLSQSVYQQHGSSLLDVDFDSLVIDESKASGYLMFRLAECASGIVVHESVKKEVERAGIQHLDWIDPKEWIG